MCSTGTIKKFKTSEYLAIYLSSLKLRIQYLNYCQDRSFARVTLFWVKQNSSGGTKCRRVFEKSSKYKIRYGSFVVLANGGLSLQNHLLFLYITITTRSGRNRFTVNFQYIWMTSKSIKASSKNSTKKFGANRFKMAPY